LPENEGCRPCGLWRVSGDTVYEEAVLLRTLQKLMI
jgi:hypothetical protein